MKRSSLKYFIFASSACFSLNVFCAQDNNPFSAFFGEWTLKNNKFQQVWDGKTVETLDISNHYTNCKPINTEKSVLCVVDAGGLKGHVLWTYNTDEKEVHHLSHFGDSRNGVGRGSLDAKGNLTTKVNFQGEPKGSYRIYEYRWVSSNEYTMFSKQYDKNDRFTGSSYGGSFIRISSNAKRKSSNKMHQ